MELLATDNKQDLPEKFKACLTALLCLFLLLISCDEKELSDALEGVIHREMTIDRHDVNLTLAGTLSIPAREGPHPAVLLLTGSGGHTRDQVISGLPMFEVIGNYLAEKGIVVLRMDDRGQGSSTGPHVRESSTAERAKDAVAAFNYLYTQSEVDTTQIGLLGHSEGTYTATLVANELRQVDFVIMLSPWAISGSELWVWQQGTILRDEGEFSESKIQSIEAELYKMVSSIGAGNRDEDFFKFGATACLAWGDPPEDISNDFVSEAFGDLRQQWYEYFFATNPEIELRKLHQPTFALFGSEDKQTPPSLNVKYLSEYLTQESHTDVTLQILPDEDHFFMTGEGLAPNEHVHGEMKMSPRALKAIWYWMEQHLKIKPVND